MFARTRDEKRTKARIVWIFGQGTSGGGFLGGGRQGEATRGRLAKKQVHVERRFALGDVRALGEVGMRQGARAIKMAIEAREDKRGSV